MENVHAVNLMFRRRKGSVLVRGHHYGGSQGTRARALKERFKRQRWMALWEVNNAAWKQLDVASQALQMLMSSWEAPPQMCSACSLR